MWQTVAEDVDRPYLLAIYAGMMGLPVFLRLDAKDSKIDNIKKDD